MRKVDPVVEQAVDTLDLPGPTRRRLLARPSGLERAPDAPCDLRPWVERARDALAVALGGVVGDRDQHAQPPPVAASLTVRSDRR